MRLLYSLLLISSSALGQVGAAADPLRPSGPVTVTADHAEWQDGGIMRYSGNVLLLSDSLQLAGDALELRQSADGQYEARIDGKPARLNHAASTGKDGKPLPPVSAEAAMLAYDSKSGVVDILGGARMTRGGDEITGDEIRYNARERRIQAAGGAGGQVKIVIQPPASAGDKAKTP